MAEPLECSVGDAVSDEESVALTCDEATLEKEGEMFARVGLRRSGDRTQFLDRPLFLEERLEQPQTRGIAQRSEALGDDFERLERKARFRGFFGHVNVPALSVRRTLGCHRRRTPPRCRETVRAADSTAS